MTFPLEVLKQPAGSLPPTVHPDRREEYLAPAEFEQVFGCDLAKWKTIPKWKRLNMKKKAGLF